MKKFKNSNIKTFDELVEKTQKPLFRLALNILKDEEVAMDIVQDTYVKAWENWYGFRAQSDPKTWLYRIAINLSLNQLKKNQRIVNFNKFTNEDLDNDNEKYTYEPADPTSIEQLLNNKERNILIKKAIDNLPINQKLVLQLFYYEGFHYQEVSEILNISVSAVESLLFRARKNLKKYLANFNIDNSL